MGGDFLAAGKDLRFFLVGKEGMYCCISDLHIADVTCELCAELGHFA